MSPLADIIPIESRRRPTPVAATVPARPGSKPQKRARIVVLLCLLALPLTALFARTGVQAPVTGLGPADRAAVFRRAYDELQSTCRLPAASRGALEDRCRNTAAFVMLFPECDAACGGAARALLPRARR
ncbi:MAG: hypothetical protein JWM82_2491 [Myxococcales bacterium]|nr:hypothetical protein [Myxococcales bacterium]